MIINRARNCIRAVSCLAPWLGPVLKFAETVRELLSGLVGSLILIGLIAASGFAQDSLNGKNRLPRVGAIRQDEQVGESKQGCGNHDLYRTKYADKAIFLSDDDGFNAWMNLNGHNAELQLVQSTLYHRDRFSSFAVYHYRFQKTRVIVSLLQLTDYIAWVPAKIVIRNGRAARVIKAFITPQCD